MIGNTDAQTVQNDILDILARFGASSVQFIAWCCEHSNQEVVKGIVDLLSTKEIKPTGTQEVNGDDMWELVS